MTYAPNSLAARDIAYSLHPYSHLAVHEERGPFIVTRGEGIYVYDDAGNRYMEGLSGLWCAGLGFSEQRLVDAAVKQMETLPFGHSFSHRASVPVIELAEKLIGMAPEPMAKAYFVNSGSEAVDTAIKMVWYYNNALDRPDKKKIISRRRAYHGVTIAAASLTGLPYVQDGWDLPIDRILHTDAPHHYREAKKGESEEAFADRLAGNLDDLIERQGPETVAAFIAEPIMGAGGVVLPPATYFDKVQAVLRRHDVLMIADEVICGFGRTGNMWGCDTYAIVPDIVICAKQLSAAYLPIGAVMVSDAVYQGFVENSRRLGMFGTGNTYGGHPVAAAVALETLKIYEERDIVGMVRAVAPQFRDRLRALSDHPLIGEARGVGLIGAIELVADKDSRRPFPAETRAALRLAENLFGRGIILRPLGPDTIGICPPMIVTEAELDTLFDQLDGALDDLHRAFH